MDSPGYLTHLRRELRAFHACLSHDLSAPVPHCAGWKLYDLADHLGRGNLWVAVAVTQHRGDYQAPSAPRDPEGLAAWFAGTSEVLLTALDTDPAASAWTIAPPPTVGFWQRRRCQETLIHRWDADQAAGRGAALDAALADDGVAEVIDTMAPRQFRMGRAPEPAHAVGFIASDTGSSRVLGPGKPVATVTAPAGALLLLLWGRLGAGDPALAWQGDEKAARVVLDTALTP